MVFSISKKPRLKNEHEEEQTFLLQGDASDEIDLTSETEDASENASENASSGKSSSERSSWAIARHQKIFFTSFLLVSLIFVGLVCAALTQGRYFFPLDEPSMDDYPTKTDRKFTVDEIFSGKFRFDRYDVDWLSDSTYLHHNSLGVVQYDMVTSSKKVVMTAKEMQDGRIRYRMKLSADRNWLMFCNNTTPLYRHSYYADYYIKDLKSGVIKKLRPPYNDREQIRYCRWSSKGDALIFVHKCNIYYIPNVRKLSRYYLLTKNGVPGKVFNGIPDWVYEEEILSSDHAIEFSPDGRYMTYVTFNITSVPFFRFPKYGPPTNMYPSIEEIAYPKAGFSNPTIRITIIDLSKALKRMVHSRQHVNPPREMSKGEYYYTTMTITAQNQLFIQWLNREQNRTICTLYDVINGVGRKVEYHVTKDGWIDDDYVTPRFSKDGRYYITMLPADVGNGKGRFRHLAKVDIDKPRVPNNYEFLTQGGYTVHDIKCWDSKGEIVYFRSTETSSRHRHVYSYNIKTKEKKCISCGVIKDKGIDCAYHTASFSKQCSWMVLSCQGPFIPKSYMISLRSGARVVLVTNNRTREELKKKDVPVVVYYSVKTADGFQIPVKESRPADFDLKRKYAVLFSVYGGPNRQRVNSKFRVKFDWVFVSNGIILVELDARGSGYYGYRHLYAVYRNLGYYESKDALTVAKYLKAKSYVDAKRMAIWGWSYGGFLSATVLSMPGNDVINTAVSVSPVADWRYYDTVYSERYMSCPSNQDNILGYQRTSLMSKARQFAGKNFMLIHGTGDDNVHFQNSAQLAAALIRANVKFRSAFYPDKKHGIHSRGHVFRLIADYLLSRLKDRREKSHVP